MFGFVYRGVQNEKFFMVESLGAMFPNIPARGYYYIKLGALQVLAYVAFMKRTRA
jgi:hypothetical protein